jgi:kynurenine 3-monooxygenase
MPKIVIIGAGLAGSLLAIYLARRNFEVEIFEARGDMRREETAAGRSINLALSDRGIAALREVGMDEYVLAEAVPMRGRMIHSTSGETKLLPYSGRKGEYINSVSRAGLNAALINKAEAFENIKFHFHRRCVGFDIASGEALFEDGKRVSGETVIATDGAGSEVRKSIAAGIEGFQSSEKFLEHGYKELHIPPSSHLANAPAKTGGSDIFALERNALHIWPRHQFMMIALPNFDGSFTCTLFLANDGPVSFERLRAEQYVKEFFEREFCDAVPLMPTLVKDFFHNPTGHLGTVRCWPWNTGAKALLLGDSAHAMVPFYGQGMNCAFEDVSVLNQLIGKYDSDWAVIFDEYGKLRKPNTDAIQDMAEENFYEMRDATADPVFQRKRELETLLEQKYPDDYSKYSMVTFREDLPYCEAKKKGNAQDELLMDLCANIDTISALELDEVMTKVRSL